MKHWRDILIIVQAVLIAWLIYTVGELREADDELRSHIDGRIDSLRIQDIER